MQVAGPDYETAVIPEERKEDLAGQEAKSVHYEVASVFASDGNSV